MSNVAQQNCPFCHWQGQDILEETANFVLLADRYPLVEGHSLLIPKVNLTCIGAIPAEQQSEFLNLLKKAQTRLTNIYGAVSAWENGGIRQQVKHAHLHLLPLPPQRTLEFPDHFWQAAWIVQLENWEKLFEWHKLHGFYQLFQTAPDQPPHLLTPEAQRRRYNEVSRARLRHVGLWSFVQARVVKKRGPKLRENLMLKWQMTDDSKRFAAL